MPAGETFHGQALEVPSSQATRSLMRGHRSAGQDMIGFAVPRALAFSFFPHGLLDPRRNFDAVKTRLTAPNVHDAVMRFTEGGCDIPIAHPHASQPLQPSQERYGMLSLGSETLAPCARPHAEGRPQFQLPGAPGQRLPFLSQASGAYLARLVELILKQAKLVPRLDAIHQTDMAEGLKAMALEGHGLAFLPVSSLRKALKARRLVPAASSGSFELTMGVRIHRERRPRPPWQGWRHGAPGLPEEPPRACADMKSCNSRLIFKCIGVSLPIRRCPTVRRQPVSDGPNPAFGLSARGLLRGTESALAP